VVWLRGDMARRCGEMARLRGGVARRCGEMARLRGGMSLLAQTLAILTPTPPPRPSCREVGSVIGVFRAMARLRGDVARRCGEMVRLRGGMSLLAQTLAILTPTPSPRPSCREVGAVIGVFRDMVRLRGDVARRCGEMVRLRGGMSAAARSFGLLAQTLAILTPTPPPRPSCRDRGRGFECGASALVGS